MAPRFALTFLLLFSSLSLMFASDTCNLYTDGLNEKITYDDPPFGNCRCEQVPVDSDPNGISRPYAASGERYAFTEWSRVKGIIVAYIQEDSLEMEWGGFGVPTDFLVQVSQFDHLYVLVSPPNSRTARKNARHELLSNGAKMSHVHLIDMLLDSWWTRDHGPWFVNRKLSNGDNEVLVVDHTYNRIQKVEWDEGGCRMYDNHVPCKFAEYLGIPCEISNLVLTGGNLMVDEHGAAASTNLVLSDNPTMTFEEIEDRMKDYFGIKSLDTFPDPQTTYIDHVDTWSKFIGAERVVVGSVPVGSQDYVALEEAADYLSEEYDVYRVPLAAYDGDKLVSGFYLNSIFINDRLYVPIITDGGAVADALNDEALVKWQDILGNAIRVVPVKANKNEEDFPMTPTTWHQWFTWDAVHCRAITVPDISYYIEGYEFPDDAEGSAATLSLSVATLLLTAWTIL